jgi:hypothetical protein
MDIAHFTKRTQMNDAARAVRAKLLSCPQGCTANELQAVTKVPMHTLRAVLAGMKFSGAITSTVKMAPTKKASQFYTLAPGS